MPSIEEVINLLEIELDKRLQELSRGKLIEITQTLVSNMDKKSFTSLKSDEEYFSLQDIVQRESTCP